MVFRKIAAGALVAGMVLAASASFAQGLRGGGPGGPGRGLGGRIGASGLPVRELNLTDAAAAIGSRHPPAASGHASPARGAASRRHRLRTGRHPNRALERGPHPFLVRCPYRRPDRPGDRAGKDLQRDLDDPDARPTGAGQEAPVRARIPGESAARSTKGTVGRVLPDPAVQPQQRFWLRT